jgi:hypothetical protein
MARQFKEQLEEEVNLENVRKAHKDAAAKEGKDAAAGTTSSAGASADVGVGNAASGADAGSTAGSATGTAASTETGAQAQIGAPTATTIPPEAYTGPDPTEFRADTFSHAHPTNEYGANPLTSNGAPEELTSPAASDASATHGGGSSPASETRANGSDAYSSGTPASTPSATEPTREPVAPTAAQTDNHGHS